MIKINVNFILVNIVVFFNVKLQFDDVNALHSSAINVNVLKPLQGQCLRCKLIQIPFEACQIKSNINLRKHTSHIAAINANAL